MNSYQFITTKTVVTITFLVILFIGIVDYLLGLKSHHTLYENALLILAFLAISLFVFITTGLYYGIKLKDNIGKLTDHIDSKKLPDFSGGVPDISTALEGIGGISEGIGGFLFAILAAFVLILFAWFFVLSAWFLIIFLAAMLYWVFFRALRLVFKNSSRCKNDIKNSLKFGVFYSLAYTSWMFAIIIFIHFIIK